MDHDAVRLSYELIRKDLDPKEEFDGSVASSFDRLGEWLEERVSYFLTHDMSLLVSFFYRFDLEEKRVSEIFALREREAICKQLTRLILERVKDKVKSRRRYEHRE